MTSAELVRPILPQINFRLTAQMILKEASWSYPQCMLGSGVLKMAVFTIVLQ